MSTYKTGNPIGSPAVKDLFDNSENLDVAVNDREADVWADRLGRKRPTLSGQERSFQNFLLKSGYQDLGTYASGLEIDRLNQIFWKDGEGYRATASLQLPYVLSGNWGEEGGLFVSVGDAALRQELSKRGGGQYIGYQLDVAGAVPSNGQKKWDAIAITEDFGIVADNGATDNKEALAAATSSGRAIYIADGVAWASAGIEPAERQGPGRIRIGNGPAFPATPFSRSKFTPRQLSGMEPERVSATLLRFYRGCCADSTGRVLIETNANIDVDTNAVGLNGLDVGAPVIGEDYFPYVLMNSQTMAVGIVLSKEISTTFVTKPAGFDLIRKLPWGFVYFDVGASAAAGVRPFAIQGWPKAFTRYTDFAMIDDWAVVKQGTANTFATFDVTAFVPDNARVAYLAIVTDHDGVGPAGSSFIRVTGAQATGVECGFVAGAGARSVVFLEHRVTSARTLTYHRSGGARTSIYVTGYSNIEPS